jgi:hypothetical protein
LASVVALDEASFESLLEQVRELHRLADDLTHLKPRFDANVRARLGWSGQAPSLPPEQRALADRVVDALTTPRLSSSQSRKLEEAFFRR